jgi:hypothetical protein
MTLAQAVPEAGRTKLRLLYGFEQASDTADLRRSADSAEIVTVQDNGVTEGKNCARVTLSRGADYAGFELTKETLKNWSEFDYVALDLYTEDEHPYTVVLELWDGLTRNYSTRCTFENVQTHRGRQTLLYPINRAKRNGKEGLAWDELQPQDKIRMDALTRVKIFVTPLQDRDTIFWIDQIRLLQADAAKPKMRVTLPNGAIAFDFGSPGATVSGFQAVPANREYSPTARFGFVAPKGLLQGGEGWPDLLTGTYVRPAPGGTLQFQAQIPNGTYHVWLAAGKILHPDLKERRFLLRLNEESLCQEEPSEAEFQGEEYLYRFLNTQYSEKPHALWRNYISRMYPAGVHKIEVKNNLLNLVAENHFVGGLILVPAAQTAEFEALTAALEQTRITAFEQTYHRAEPVKPRKQSGDGDYVLYVPDPGRTIGPHTDPSVAERGRKNLITAGVPGQRVVLRVVVTPFADLGRSSLNLADLKGESAKLGSISADKIRGHFQNYRSDGKSLGEMALIPTLSLEMEKGITQCFWLWLEIPAAARPGIYTSAFSFRTERGHATPIPLTLEVYPFHLADAVPASFGMYYRIPDSPAFPAALQRKLIKEQLAWMREIGFTGVQLNGPAVLGLDKNDTARLRFDSQLWELAREVGMGRRPEQLSMAASLSVARGVGRWLPEMSGIKIDQNPGLELRQPDFQRYYLNAMQQYGDFIRKSGLPIAMEIVDEPRETPNPWNRNLADTITYGDLLHQVPGLRTFVDPIADVGDGKDYTALVDHADIISVHAWKASSRLIRKTHDRRKTLWLYNTGMDRFSWGFYNWRVRSAGRWEWHFCWPEDQAVGGYPGREWYNPFTSQHGFASAAPCEAYRGGMLYQSRFLEVAEGITDYTYLYTLSVALQARKTAGNNPKGVQAAETFLAGLQRTIPEFPQIQGLSHESDGALVGAGIEGAASRQVVEWRREIAELLRILEQ